MTDQAGQELTKRVGIDTSGQAGLEELNNQATQGATKSVGVEDEAARQRLISLAEEANQGATKSLSLNDTEAVAQLDELTARLGSSIVLPVDADTTAAEAKLDELSQRSGFPVAKPIDVDTADASARIDDLDLRAREPQTKVVSVEFTGQDRPEDDGHYTRTVVIDDASARATLEDLSGSAEQPLSKTVGIETAEARTQIDDLTARIGQTVVMPVGADIAKAEALIDRLRSEAHEPLDVAVRLSTEGTGDADAQKRSLEGPVDVPLRVEADDAAARASLADLDTPITKPVDLDTTGAQLAVDRFMARAGEPVVKTLTFDDDQARTTLDGLDERIREPGPRTSGWPSSVRRVWEKRAKPPETCRWTSLAPESSWTPSRPMPGDLSPFLSMPTQLLLRPVWTASVTGSGSRSTPWSGSPPRRDRPRPRRTLWDARSRRRWISGSTPTISAHGPLWTPW